MKTRSFTSRLLSSTGSITDTFQYSALGVSTKRTGTTSTATQWLASDGVYEPQGPSLGYFFLPGWNPGILWDPAGGSKTYDPGYLHYPDWNSVYSGLLGIISRCLIDPWCGIIVVGGVGPGIPGNPGQPVPPPNQKPPPNQQPPPGGIPPNYVPPPEGVISPGKDPRSPCQPIGLPSTPREGASWLKLVTCLAACWVDSHNHTEVFGHQIIPNLNEEVPDPCYKKWLENAPKPVKEFVEKIEKSVKDPVCVINCFVKFWINWQDPGDTESWQMCTCSGGYAATQDQCETCCEDNLIGGLQRFWYNQCIMACLNLSE